MRKLLNFSACLLLFTGMLAQALRAQASYGGVSGTVKSTTGAAMPDVKIELENVATGTRITATSDSSGNFRFENVPAGRYRIITTSGKVAAVPSPEFDVTNNRINVMNVTIAPGPATDVITMVEAPPRSLDTAQITTYYTTEQIQNLPRPNLMERDGNIFGAYNLSLLSEGVTSGGIGEGPALSVTGLRPVQNLFHIDGADNKNYLTNNALAYVSPMATKDFVMLQNQTSPLFGHLTGGKLNSTILSGTNQVHGSLYEDFQNQSLNALEPTWKNAGISEPRFDQNRLGGSVGLPFIPNHLFFYGDFEYIPFGFTRFNIQQSLAPTPQGYTTLAGVPGVSQSNLNFLQNNLTTDQAPTQFTTVNGVAIPLAPSLQRLSGFRNNYMGTGSLEAVISDRQRLNFRYVHNKIDEGARGSGSTFSPAVNSFTPTNNTALVASAAYYFTLSPMLINELRAGYNRFDQTLDSIAAGYFSSNPNFQINGPANFLSPLSTANARNSVQNTYHLADALAVRIGPHNFRAGYDGRNVRLTRRGFLGIQPNLVYSDLEHFVTDSAPLFSQQAFGPSDFSDDQWSHLLFVNDSWRLRPNINIDLGVTWQYATLPNSISRLWDTNGVSGTLANGANTGWFNGITAKPGTDKTAFAPKVGVAWAPGNRNTVVRAGFGMQYDTLYLSQINPTLFPFSLTAFGNPTGTSFLTSGGIQNPYANATSLNLTSNQLASLNGTILGDQQLPYVMRWNVGIQQSVWQGFVAEVSYLGTKGTNLPWLTNLNPIATPNNSLPLFFNQPNQAQLDALPTTLTQLLVGSGGTLGGNPLYTFSNSGNSSYHALAVNFRQRVIRGFELFGHYTYSHAINDSNGTVLDLVNPTRSRLTSIYDRRQRGTASVLWDVAGAFSDQTSMIRNILANFVIGATYTYESAQYLPLGSSIFGTSFASPAIINAGGIGAAGTTPLTNSNGAVVGYLVNSPNAGIISGGLGTFAGTNNYAFPLDVTNNVDFTVSKGFGWQDRANFEVRGTAYNVFNSAQYVGRTIDSVNFPTVLNNTTFLQPGSAAFQGFTQVLPANARTLQLSLRVEF